MRALLWRQVTLADCYMESYFAIFTYMMLYSSMPKLCRDRI
jgi:hypothetical protein